MPTVAPESNRFTEYKFSEKGLGKTWGSTRDYVFCIHMPWSHKGQGTANTVQDAAERLEKMQDTAGKVFTFADYLSKTLKYGAAGTAIAGATGGGAVVGFFALPIMAGVVAIYNIGKYAYSFYSNRESQHKKLNEFVWSGIDKKRPIQLDRNNIKEPAAAAHYLLLNAENQMERGMQKLLNQMNLLESDMRKLVAIADIVAREGNALGGVFTNRSLSLQSKKIKQLLVFENIKTGFKLIDKMTKPGGVIQQTARRVQHFSNYLQAPMIYANAMAANFCNFAEIKQLDDPFAQGAGADLRQKMQDISNLIDAFYNLSLETIDIKFYYRLPGLMTEFNKRCNEWDPYRSKVLSQAVYNLKFMGNS